jgi:hypothetical protein
MINAEFFKEHLDEQVKMLGMCEIVLSGGEVVQVKQVHVVADGFLVVEVYPVEGMTEEQKNLRRPFPGGQPRWDRMAIPYEAIARVNLTIMEPGQTPADESAPFGFQCTTSCETSTGPVPR